MIAIERSEVGFSPKYLKPDTVANHLSPEQSYCLFVDIDGTLAAFTLDPKDSFIPNATINILQNIQALGIPIAAVTGRSLVEAKQMLAPLKIPIAATHGLEIDLNSMECSGLGHDATAPLQYENNININTIELQTIKQLMVESISSFDELTIEDKPYSVAMHYRNNPDLGDISYRLVMDILKNYTDWELKQGKYVWEIVPKGVNKGTAILTLLSSMDTCSPHSRSIGIYRERCPIFIGDDVTDEKGFTAVQSRHLKSKNVGDCAQGMGVKVGNEETNAHFYVQNIKEVQQLLEGFLQFFQTQFGSTHASINELPR